MKTPERVVLSIGTKKGLFVAEAPRTRRSFALRGPFGPGVGVYATLIDTRGTPRLYASSCNPFFGMKVLRSTDLGRSFKETKSAPAFPKDDGRALRASNRGVDAGFAPDPFPEFGQCVHKIAGHPKAHSRFYMQNHGGWAKWDGPGGPRPDIGVLRSDDHGQTWRSIAKGLPTDFGFPIVVHPHDPESVYVAPLEPMTRTCPGGAPAVWRSEDGGGSWRRLARGLPKKESFFTILRDAMDIDDQKSPALYFGTTTGQLWIGRDGGESWDCLYDSLPPINCVKVATV